MENESLRFSLRKKIRLFIVITIIGLLANGLSAFFLEPELRIILGLNILPTGTQEWLTQVHNAILDTLQRYPFMLYGYDWLGFAHLLIATAFIGPLKDPVKNEWVIEFGMIAAFLSIVIALLFERVRAIPFFWSLIDVLVGFIAFLIILCCYLWLQQLKKLEWKPSQ